MKSQLIVALCVALFLSMWATAMAATVSVTIPATEDAFVREQDPTLNYGASGALNVSGPNALNSLGQPTGRMDCVIKFNASAAVSAFDTAFGAGFWKTTSSSLALNEVGFPNNSMFNMGLGDFEVRWLSDDNWIQGTGRPVFPVVGTGQEMTWNLLQSMLSSATESSLGQFSNTQTSAPLTFNLTTSSQFAADITSGGSVTLHLAPVTDGIGFTFNSSNYIIPSNAPQLTVRARSVRGDLNCDDLINLDDVAPFVTALLDPTAYAAQFPGCNILRADMNADGSTNGLDIPGFTAAILSNP